jgi:hypothetical protein
LEKYAVRAVAIEALVKFASSVASLCSCILLLLLQWSLVDEDDKTWDRAATAVKVLPLLMEQHPYVPHFDHIDPAADSEEESQYAESPANDDVASLIFLQPLHMNFDKLEQSIQTYISTPAISNPEALMRDKLPIVEDYAEISATIVHKAMDITSLDAAIAATADVVMLHPREKEAPAATAYAILELAALGGVLPSSAPVHLPESESKYVVTCIHHIMPKYVFPHQF